MSERAASITAALARIPYAGFLGVRPEITGEQATLILPYREHLIGNPLLPALHGGVVSALMEYAALAQLALAAADAARVPKTIDIYVDYLRTGRPADTFASARVIKLGRRVANVEAKAWQGDRAQPIASLRGHFLLPDATAN